MGSRVTSLCAERATQLWELFIRGSVLLIRVPALRHGLPVQVHEQGQGSCHQLPAGQQAEATLEGTPACGAWDTAHRATAPTPGRMVAQEQEVPRLLRAGFLWSYGGEREKGADLSWGRGGEGTVGQTPDVQAEREPTWS